MIKPYTLPHSAMLEKTNKTCVYPNTLDNRECKDELTHPSK